MDPSLEYACKRILELEQLLLVDVPETVWPAEVAMVLSQVESAGILQAHHKQRPRADAGEGVIDVSGGRFEGPAEDSGLRSDMRPLEVNGFWRDADWLFCRDGKWRPVEPCAFPLANGFSKGMGHGKSSPRALAGRNRVGRLKGYGNAINAQAAAAFIRAYMEVA